MKVIKRDGTKCEYVEILVTNAVFKATEDTGTPDKKLALKVAKGVTGMVDSVDEIHVNDIQALVEKELMSANKDVARAYIDYRTRRDVAREEQSPLHAQIMGLMGGTNKEVIDENANKDGRVLHTQRDLLAGIVAKHYGLNYVLPRHVAAAHTSGDIHYHDLDYSPFFPITNCCLVDIPFMFKNGFRMGAAEIETPKSIATAAALVAQVIAQVSSSQYGGTTIGDIDIALAPYVKASYEKHLEMGRKWTTHDPKAYAKEMTEKETFDAMQSLLYEVNTLHTSNGQTPFCTFGFGMGDTWEAKLVQKGILENQRRGLGKKQVTPVFPKLVFAVKEGHNVNPEDPFYDVMELALDTATKRMYPDILSFKHNTRVTGSDKITYPMGCRSFLSAWQNEEGEYVTSGRNNLGVVSLNLPRIAIESNGDFDKFWDIFNAKMEICKDALWARIDSVENTPASVAPILYMEGAFGVKLKADDKISELFKNGRATISIGYIGLHEVAMAMFPEIEHTYESEEAQVFLKKIVKEMKNFCNLWKEESGYAFGLYSTPSESLCNRFQKLDEKRFGVVPRVTDKGYYTNSFHLDVWKKVNPAQKFAFEADYPTWASGGHISYAEYPDMKKNKEGLYSVWKFAINHVPYFGTNLPVDKCFKCGCDDEFTATKEGYKCPKCGNTDEATISVIRRTCGYLGSVGSIPYNPGKQDEVLGRVKHV